MVKKLFKHEFLALGRLILPIICALLGVGIFARVLLFFESDTIAYQIIEGSTFTVLVLAILASMILTTIFGVIRYYKNLFSCEGYLSFTLPVTPAQHLWVKVITAVTFDVIVMITIVCSLMIALSGEPLTEFVKAGVYLWKHMGKELEMVHIVLYMIEFAILIVFSSFVNYFLYYTCITIGQTAKKNRVMWAVGVYFIYNIICQVISTVVSIVLSVVAYSVELEDIVIRLLEEYTYVCIHAILLGSILWSVILGAVCFIVCHTIIRKKLNLE